MSSISYDAIHCSVWQYIHTLMYIEIDAWIQHRTLLIENNLLNIYSVSKLNSISWKCILFVCENAALSIQVDWNRILMLSLKQISINSLCLIVLPLTHFHSFSFNEYSYWIEMFSFFFSCTKKTVFSRL